jgi:CDP-diacylglycerol--glycerol-3-phosphate 3-phosphatidyltransferase
MIKHIPNAITIFRIALVPLLILLLCYRDLSIFNGIHTSWLNYFAGFVFVVASISDFFDGYIARLYKLESKLGEILDPFSDKILMLGAFLSLLYIGRADVICVFLIIGREFLVTTLRIIAVSQNKEIKSDIFGKAKTVIQMFAVGFLIMDWSGGDILLYIAVGATLLSAISYVSNYVNSANK